MDGIEFSITPLNEYDWEDYFMPFQAQYNEQDEYLEGVCVEKEERGKGLFKNFLKNWTSSADKKQIYLFLQVYPDECINKSRLMESYKSYGFIHVAQGWMYRPPLFS